MSHRLISHSSDLKKLQDEGFAIQVKGALLLVHDVPYVNPKKEIARGTLVSKLNLAGPDKIAKPENHVVYFIGDHPCNNDGVIIKGIQNASVNTDLGHGVVVNHTFSGKLPDRNYEDYYEKVTAYIKILSSQAESIDPSVTAKTFRAIESEDPDSVFHYPDTNSSRAEINAISARLGNLKIAIIGLGGTGSYILDLVAKTWVKEIHLFDGDLFLLHNNYRTPGAASGDKLNGQTKKVIYLHEIYSKLRKNIIPRDYYLAPENLHELSGMDFVFVCIDRGEIKRQLIEKLIEFGVSFIDTGIGVYAIGDALTGSVRVTTCTAKKTDHINRRISFDDKANNDYTQNIQIAELNALNAALAVIKWKKLYGFYHDLEKEYHASYEININKVINDEVIS